MFHELRFPSLARHSTAARFIRGHGVCGSLSMPLSIMISEAWPSPSVAPRRTEGPDMNYKKVLEWIKEKQFGVDREHMVVSDAANDTPDGFCEETTVYRTGLDGVTVPVEIFVPPAASTATRKPPERTKGHARGLLVDPRNNRAVTFASTREMRCALILLASPEIAEVYDQPPAVAYIDAEGIKRMHTPDYLAVDRNGRKCAIAVKPSRAVEKSGIEDTMKRIRPVLGDYAEDIILLTDAQLTRPRAYNAESALHANSCRVQSHCDRVMAIIGDIEGQVNAYEVAKTFGDFASGMNAVWCLVYDGLLALADPSRILPDSPYVVMAPAHRRRH